MAVFERKASNYNNNNPQKYVQRIIDTLRLTVTKSLIDDALYRYNENKFEDNVQKWNRIIGADQYYNILSTQKNPWKIINDFEDQVIPKAQ